MTYSSIPLFPNECVLYAKGPLAQACNDPYACKLKVEGNGSIKVRPDTAVVILTVVTENMELSIAQEENTNRMNAVLRSLRENGIPMEDIQTQSYNIIPQYDFIEGKQVLRGYKVEHSLEVTIRDMTKIGEVIDDAVKNGVNQVSNITFSVENPSDFYQLALNAAVDDALKKARTLGTKLNIAVSKVPVQIVEIGYETGIPKQPFMYQAAGSVTPVQTGAIEISARIAALFAYRSM